jgi:hypothetical protein
LEGEHRKIKVESRKLKEDNGKLKRENYGLLDDLEVVNGLGGGHEVQRMT